MAGTDTQDRTAYCGRCGNDDLGRHFLCPRGVIDNGADRDVVLEPSRYEGTCLACCGHNHA